MEKPKRKNSEKPKYEAKYIPDNARAIAIFVTFILLCVPTYFAGLLVLLNYGLVCQYYSGNLANEWVFATMLLCIALFLWWIPYFIAERLTKPTHLKITPLTLISTAILIAILFAFGLRLPCLPI